MSNIELVFIMDSNYIKQTMTAIMSIIKNKNSDTSIVFNIVLVDVDNAELISTEIGKLESQTIKFNYIKSSSKKYEHLHRFREGQPCVATTVALLKFDLPQLLSHLEKVLYLDGDILVTKDLTGLYETVLEDNLVAAVVDSGSIYYQHKYVKSVANYFNSGVMLLNLEKMRAENYTQQLIDKKLASKDSLLMDQNIFNLVFDEKVKLLPIKYNFLYVSLVRAKSKYTIKNINDIYDTNYSNLHDIYEDASIIHFSSKDKPWKYTSVPGAIEWNRYYRLAQSNLKLISNNNSIGTKLYEKYGINKDNNNAVKVSVIIPIYNLDKYLMASVSSISNQSLQNIEIICIDDGSEDSSLAVLKFLQKVDNRIQIFALKENSGQSVARNVGLKHAKGEYVYFFDGDDSLEENALEYLYNSANELCADLLLFEGKAYYEDESLKAAFPYYIDGYKRKNKYEGVFKGDQLYIQLTSNYDYKVSPCLQFIKKELLDKYKIEFLEGVTYEDNLFSLMLILSADRVSCINKVFFNRRVRQNSTITAGNHYKAFKDRLIVLGHMYEYIIKSNLSPDVLFAVDKQLNSLHKSIICSYNDLPKENQHFPFIDNPKTAFINSLLFTMLRNSKDENPYRKLIFMDLENERRTLKNEISIIKAEMERSQTELENIKSGYSFRMGRIFTWLPRMIRGGFRCYREHGFLYTLRRTAFHLGLSN